MKKVLFLYNRPDGLDISKYPFFHKLIEACQGKVEVSFLEYNKSSLTDLSYGIKHYYNVSHSWTNYPLISRYRANLFQWFVTAHIRKYSYDHIVTIGAGCIAVLPHIKRNSTATLHYLDDEFPWVFRHDDDAVSHAISAADQLIVLDRLRESILRNRLQLHQPSFLLPNIPSLQQLQTASVNWIEKLQLDPGYRYVLFHGSLGQKCQLPEILCTLPLWPSTYRLIIIGWYDELIEYYRHLLSDKVTVYKGRLTDAEYSSLIQFCDYTIGLYSMYMDRELVGMSSGRVLRSAMLGTPVIANDYPSMNFVSELKIGTQVHSVLDIPAILQQKPQPVDNLNNTLNAYYADWVNSLLQSEKA